MSDINLDFIKYKGYTPSDRFSNDVERVSHDLNPNEFYERFVSLRRPVVITNVFNSEEWKINAWANDYLMNKAGNVNVLIEKLDSHKEQKFGFNVPKISMQYSEFLQEINAKNDRFYMTTQDLEKDQSNLDDYGMPENIMSEPLSSLKDDFPTRPKLLNNLIPHQISLWQGFSENGSSSGLHHDFHDNLYIVIRGKKRFRLFPPSSIQKLKTSGRPVVVYENGLIVYEKRRHPGIIPVRSDGLPLVFLARMKRNRANRELNRAERELAKLESSSLRFNIPNSERMSKIENFKQEIDKWEKELDEALQELLGYDDSDCDDYVEEDDLMNMGGGGVISIHGDDSDEEEDDDNDSKNPSVISSSATRVTPSETMPTTSSSVININENSLNEVDSSEPPQCKRQCMNSNAVDNSAVQENNTMKDDNEITSNTMATTMSNFASVDESKSSKAQASADKTDSNNNNSNHEVASSKVNDTESNLPNHFCRIELPTSTDDPEEIFKSIENSEDLRCLVVSLESGDALYLPASWFHEVTSYSQRNTTAVSKNKDGGGGDDGDNDINNSSVDNSDVGSSTDKCNKGTSSGSSGKQNLDDHLALNYWFYPPNGSTYQQPYVDDFWSKRFESIEQDGGLFKKKKQTGVRSADDDVICLGSDDDDDDDDDDDNDEEDDYDEVSDSVDGDNSRSYSNDAEQNANKITSSSHSNGFDGVSRGSTVVIDEDDSTD